MSRRRTRSSMGAEPGGLWTILGIAYNYVDYDDLLRGLQVCRRLRQDLPEVVTHIQSRRMTQAGLEFIAKNFIWLEQLVIKQEKASRPLPSKHSSANEDEFGNDEEHLVCEDLDGDKQDDVWASYALDFGRVRLPHLRRLAVKRSPMATLTFTKRNTPALTDLRICDTEGEAPKVLKLKLANLRQLYLEHVRLQSTLGFVRSLMDCPQLSCLIVRSLGWSATLDQITELQLPSCKYLALDNCGVRELRVWSPCLRMLSLRHNDELHNITVQPALGEKLLLDLTRAPDLQPLTVHYLQRHPRIGRQGVLGLGARSLCKWAALSIMQRRQQRLLQLQCITNPGSVCGEAWWVPRGWTRPSPTRRWRGLRALWDFRSRNLSEEDAYVRGYMSEVPSGGNDDDTWNQPGDVDELCEEEGNEDGYDADLDWVSEDFDSDVEPTESEEEDDPVRRYLFSDFMMAASSRQTQGTTTRAPPGAAASPSSISLPLSALCNRPPTTGRAGKDGKTHTGQMRPGGSGTAAAGLVRSQRQPHRPSDLQTLPQLAPGSAVAVAAASASAATGAINSLSHNGAAAGPAQAVAALPAGGRVLPPELTATTASIAGAASLASLAATLATQSQPDEAQETATLVALLGTVGQMVPFLLQLRKQRRARELGVDVADVRLSQPEVEVLHGAAQMMTAVQEIV